MKLKQHDLTYLGDQETFNRQQASNIKSLNASIAVKEPVILKTP